MHRFEGCVVFYVHSRTLCACAFFCVFLNGACACTPCVVLVHADFIASCIVLDLLEMHFWPMSELLSVLKMLDSCNHL